MGMLMHRHRVEQMKAEQEAGKAKPKRRRSRKAKPAETHNPEAAPAAELGEAEPDGTVQEPAEGTSADPNAEPDKDTADESGTEPDEDGGEPDEDQPDNG